MKNPHLQVRNQYEIMTIQLIFQKYYNRIYHTFPFKFPEKISKCLSIREGLKKELTNGWINPFGLAGWSQQGAKIQPKKILFSNKNTKMIRMI